MVQVLINGKVSGFFERSNPRNLPLPNIFSDIGPNEEVGQRFTGAHSRLLVTLPVQIAFEYLVCCCTEGV